MRIALACALIGGLLAAAATVGEERNYRARSFVIRVPPSPDGQSAVAYARRAAILRRTVALSSVAVPGGVTWLDRHSSAELTGRLDLALTVSAPTHDQAVALATAYAKATKRSLPADPALNTHGRGARRAQLERGPLAWGMIGAVAGLWVGAAVAITWRHRSAGPARHASLAAG